eukprot:TRINITY_DN1231_c0_g1_i6.p1 TRINITY_DN1231_c0_g1~~TRINITY_DN1231_c0_g1_i6.p1  ORF type:complete len:115 (+),score=32.91 TRINITY_DN1231_c0_g1_i6:329-673(+)
MIRNYREKLLPLLQKIAQIDQHPPTKECGDGLILLAYGFQVINRKDESISSRIRKLPVVLGGIVQALDVCGDKPAKNLTLEEIPTDKKKQGFFGMIHRLFERIHRRKVTPKANA